MTTGDFDWFLHTMLFYHTQHVIQKQSQQKQIHQINEFDNDKGEENEPEENEPDTEERQWDVEEE